MAEAVLVFDGVLDREAFLSFCTRRARLLALDLEVMASNAQHVTVAVAGHPVLIDMFEMACSLGPPDSIVHTIDRRQRNRVDA